MKKILMILAVGIVVAAVAAPNGYFLANSDGTIDVVATDAVLSGGVTAQGNVQCADLNTSDDAVIADDALISGWILAEPALSTATNGAALTPASTLNVVSGIGGANDTTNTVTLGSAQDGRMLIIAVNIASTNLIKVADSGTAVLASDWIGDAGDSITLVGTGGFGSYVWTELSRSDN